MMIFITGMSGVGKTTVLKELSKKGYTTIDLDDTELCRWEDKKTGEKVLRTGKEPKEWYKENGWRVDVSGLKELLNTHDSENVYIGGKVAKSQLFDVLDLMDLFILLTVDDEQLKIRQLNRKGNNDFAKLSNERSVILKDKKIFEHHCVNKYNAILINNKVLNKTVNDIIKLS